jgi:uncharacterized membrane protein HdeD (DUF308 family)
LTAPLAPYELRERKGGIMTAPAGLFETMGRNWWVLVFFGLVAIAFGVVAIVSPFEAAAAMIWAFGIMAVAEGFASTFRLFDRREDSRSKVLLGLYAVASFVFGVLALTRPVALAGAMLLVLAAWLIVAGVFRIAFAIRVREVVTDEWMLGLSGVLIIGLGVVMVAFPLPSLLALMVWIAVAALIYGVLQMAAGLRVRRLLEAYPAY